MLLSHVDVGQGPAVVLLHSGVCDRRMWDTQVEVLRDSWRVVAPDLRGFGESPLPGGRFAYATDVVHLLDHLSLDRAFLVGSSFGGKVALEIAGHAPDRVTALALLCPALGGLADTPTLTAFAEEEGALLEAGDLDAAVELNVRTWLGPDAGEETRDLVRRMQRHAFEVDLAAAQLDPAPELDRIDVDPSAIAVPTLVVSGGHDLDHFQAVATHLTSQIQDARLLTLPWAGHLPSLERPEETSRIIVDFLREQSR